MFQKLVDFYFSLLCWFRRREVNFREHRPDNRREYRRRQMNVRSRIRVLRDAVKPIMEFREESGGVPALAVRDETNLVQTSIPAPAPSAGIAQKPSDRSLPTTRD